MRRFIAVLVLALAAATGFSQERFSWVDSRTDDPDKMLPGVNPAKVLGAIVTAGSSTVYPLSVIVTENFRKDGYTGNVSIDSIGSGGGFERFGKGELDVTNASSKIKQAQLDAATTANKGKVLEFVVGTDALSVVVSKKNAFAKDLTLKELALAFSTAEYWSDIRPGFPKKTIVRYSPGTDSGTFEYFVEHVFKKDKKPLLSAKNLNLSEDDNVLVQGVSGDEYAIGYFGYAYFDENKTRISALAIDGVAPSAASINARQYPLARPLFLYSTDSILKAKPQVAAFIAYYLSNVNRLIRKAGYFPASPEALNAGKQLWLDSVKGQY
jgi:phosphate transport system substrate-binding protein